MNDPSASPSAAKAPAVRIGCAACDAASALPGTADRPDATRLPPARSPLRPRSTLRSRLLLVYLVPVGILVVVGGLLAYSSARAMAVEELGRQLIAIAQAVAGSLSSTDASRIARLEPGMDRTQKNLERKLIQLKEATGVRRIFIVDPQLAAKVDTRDGTLQDVPLPEALQDRQEISDALVGRPRASLLFTGADGVRYLTGYAGIREPGSEQVVGVVGVEGSSSLFRTVDRLGVHYGTAGLILLALLFGLSLVVSQRITRPVRQLAEAAHQIGSGDLDSEVEVRGHDELAVLARALNDMRLAIRQREQDLQLMLSGIAHEVRNPLGGMELFSGLLAEEVASQPTASQYAERIRKELEHLKRVVNEFLDFARRTPLQRSVVMVEPLLREVVDTTVGDPVAGACQFEVVVIPQELCLEADLRRLRQVLLNLVRNSCQAMPGGGVIRLRAGCQPDEVRIEVEDEGPGIPAALREQIFRPFFTTREKGTGLGLALCHKIVSDHGGRIELRLGTGGRGTCMILHLPTSRAAQSLAAPLPPADERLGGGDPLIGNQEGMIGGDEPLIG